MEVDLKAIEEAFVERVLAQLHKRELISDDDVAQLLSQDHTGSGVWMGDPFHDKESEQFVARYIERAPLSLEKLSIQDDIVTYTTKDGAAHEFDALEFLAALSCHVPKTYESITRYYGRYSCRRRGERAKIAPLPEEHESDYSGEFRRSSWAACIKRIYEVDPLECPKCKAPCPWYTLLYQNRPNASEPKPKSKMVFPLLRYQLLQLLLKSRVCQGLGAVSYAFWPWYHPIPTNRIPSQGLDKNCCSRHSPARSLNLKEAATPPLIGTQRLWQFQRIFSN